MKINTSKIVIYTIVFIIILFFFDFFYRTLIYRNHLTKCKDDGSFCGIKIINIFLPHEYNYKLLDFLIKPNSKLS